MRIRAVTYGLTSVLTPATYGTNTTQTVGTQTRRDGTTMKINARSANQMTEVTYQVWAKVYKKDYPLHAAQVPRTKGTSLHMAVGSDQKMYVGYTLAGNGSLLIVGLW